MRGDDMSRGRCVEREVRVRAAVARTAQPTTDCVTREPRARSSRTSIIAYKLAYKH